MLNNRIQLHLNLQKQTELNEYYDRIIQKKKKMKFEAEDKK